MKRLLVGLLFAAAAVFACSAGEPKKEDVSLPKPTIVKELFDAAIELGGYKALCDTRPGGCPLPDVRVGKTPHENIRGTFDYRAPGFVSVSADHDAPGTLEWNETLVHEFTHYLQWLAGKYNPGRADVCEMMLEIESEAYIVGHKYLARYGVIKDTEQAINGQKFNYMFCKMAQLGFGG